VSVGAIPGKLATAESTATEEFQVQGHTSDSRLTYQGGGYLEVSLPVEGFQSYYSTILLNCTNSTFQQCSDLVGTAFGIPGFVGSQAVSQTEYKFRDLAAYSQATYQLTDQLSLTGGVRYTSDLTRGLGEVLQSNYPTPNTPVWSCQLPSPAVKGGTSAQVLADPSLCDYRSQQSSHAPTWTVDLEYKPVDNVMVYAKDSRGYRQGDVNVSFYGLGNWAPEKVDTYEIGAKTSFERFVRGTFDIAAFYNNFTNQQLSVSETSCTPAELGTAQCPFIAPPSAGIANAGKSKIEGVEVDSSILPLTGVRLDFAYTYLDTKLQSVDLPTPPLGFTAVSFPSTVGGPLAYSPKHKGTLTAGYTLPIDASIGSVALSTTFTYQTSQFNNQNAAPGFQTLGPQANLNLNLNWSDVFGKPLDFSLYATNVTDRKFIQATEGIYTSFGYDVGYLNPPLMYGARVKYSFK
jgi:iron complex outermembrane receptor protein